MYRRSRARQVEEEAPRPLLTQMHSASEPPRNASEIRAAIASAMEAMETGSRHYSMNVLEQEWRLQMRQGIDPNALARRAQQERQEKADLQLAAQRLQQEAEIAALSTSQAQASEEDNILGVINEMVALAHDVETSVVSASSDVLDLFGGLCTEVADKMGDASESTRGRMADSVRIAKNALVRKGANATDVERVLQVAK